MSDKVGLMARENMLAKPTVSRGTKEDALGSVKSGDKELEAALMQLCGNAKDASEAKMFMEMLNYLPYLHAEQYNPSGTIKPTTTRYLANELTTPNGYLERKNHA